MIDEIWEYYIAYGDEDMPIKKGNRRAKREKIERNKEAFMKINGRGLISDTLPIIAKKAKEIKRK